MNEINFWDVHGLWFCFFMFLFPRLTLFFGGIVTGGWLWAGLVWNRIWQLRADLNDFTCLIPYMDSLYERR